MEFGNEQEEHKRGVMIMSIGKKSSKVEQIVMKAETTTKPKTTVQQRLTSHLGLVYCSARPTSIAPSWVFAKLTFLFQPVVPPQFS